MELALRPHGELRLIVEAVINDDRLRLDIRAHQFNIYYGGGNLMLVGGRRSPWEARFDTKYFKGGTLIPPVLPTKLTSTGDSRAWMRAFPQLMAGMEDWWQRHPKGERAHCQAIAAANSAVAGLPQSDYLILDLEYQWAQRRFDLVAARRHPTPDDDTGWVEPELVLIEVKSEYGACRGSSGLGDHARDFQNIVLARGGQSVSAIKLEFQNMLFQKMRLELIHAALGFKQFSPAAFELLIVFIGIDPTASKISAPIAEVAAISESLGTKGRIRFMQLTAPAYVME
jgi:hypothetical protein